MLSMSTFGYTADNPFHPTRLSAYHGRPEPQQLPIGVRISLFVANFLNVSRITRHILKAALSSPYASRERTVSR
jgi:hypothetical protein